MPAMISPFALAKIGRSAARELFLTGTRFVRQRAREIGLVHAVVAAADLDAESRQYLEGVLSAGPDAIAEASSCCRAIWLRPPREVQELMAESIAARRVIGGSPGRHARVPGEAHAVVERAISSSPCVSVPPEVVVSS